jgi:hypothetical protein
MNRDFKCGQKILWRDSIRTKWKYGMFSHYNSSHKDKWPYSLCDGEIPKYCIAYEGNEKLEGTTGEP